MIKNHKQFLNEQNDPDISYIINRIKSDWIEKYGKDAEDESMYASCDEFANRIALDLEDNKIEYNILNTMSYSKRVGMSGDVSGFDTLVYRKKYNRWNSKLPYYINDPKYFGKYEFPYHEWIYVKGKHYDFVSSDGVDSAFDLQIFKDYFKYILENS